MNRLAAPIQLAVIGGGPAGLRAAEVAATSGIEVTLFEAMPSVGRKFLVAGKGGLNLSHDEPPDKFASRFSGPDQPAGFWDAALTAFGPADMRQWAAALGIPTFQTGNGRIYPVSLKAAPLLRRWVQHLRDLGVRFAVNHPWQALTPGRPLHVGFSNNLTIRAEAVVLALGGGSWPQTGSTGTWTRVLAAHGIAQHPLTPANCGWECPWSSELLSVAEGKPLKNLLVRAADTVVAGELLVTRHGLEGGAIYQLGNFLRAMPQPTITIDFKPTFSESQLVAKMQSVRGDFLAEARTRWKLGTAAHAILARKSWTSAAALAHEAKHCVINLTGPRPLAEAISSAGGICWSELDAALMLKKIPGVFVAGEMIDWDAPTGGYLIHGCFATATRAAASACSWLQQ